MTKRATAAGALAKVPELTLYFWITKILTTGAGETTSDYLANSFGPAVDGAVGIIGIVATLWWQFSADRYRAWNYWLTVVMVSVFGTMAADGMHIALDVPYVVSSTVYGLILAGILWAWYRSEGTLSIKSITTVRRERFYWATVFATFACGTAVGDLTAINLHLGYIASGVMFTVAFALPLVAVRAAGLNAIVGFWAAYILTRPLGASFADWLAKPKTRGGLGFGDGPVSLVWGIVIFALIAYLARTRIDVIGARARTERVSGRLAFDEAG
jgi:uncharacterized membrane-anchored protein